MINVLINGFEGRMGQEVYKLTQSSDNFKCVAGIDKYSNVNEITEKESLGDK